MVGLTAASVQWATLIIWAIKILQLIHEDNAKPTATYHHYELLKKTHTYSGFLAWSSWLVDCFSRLDCDSDGGGTFKGPTTYYIWCHTPVYFIYIWPDWEYNGISFYFWWSQSIYPCICIGLCHTEHDNYTSSCHAFINIWQLDNLSLQHGEQDWVNGGSVRCRGPNTTQTLQYLQAKHCCLSSWGEACSLLHARQALPGKKTMEYHIKAMQKRWLMRLV